MSREIEEAREKFQFFLFEMDDVLEAFIAESARDGFALELSMDGLPVLEALLLKSRERLMTDDERALLNNRAARFLGELFRVEIGGQWDLCLERRNIAYGLPTITGHYVSPVRFVPLHLVEIFLLRPRAGLLRTAILADTIGPGFAGQKPGNRA